MLKFTLPI